MKKIIMTYAAGRMVLTFFFCCAMTTVVNAQSSVEDLLKSAEQKAKLGYRLRLHGSDDGCL